MGEQKKIQIHLSGMLGTVEIDQLKELMIKILEEKFGLAVKIYGDYPDLVCVIGDIEVKEATLGCKYPGDAALRHIIVGCDYWMPETTSGRHGGA